VNAVKSAVEIQTLNRQDPKIDVRIGIHTGDVMIDDNGVYGDSVNVSSRIESLALPGSILVSEKLYDELKNDETISTKSLGFVALKNVKQPVHIYAITNRELWCRFVKSCREKRLRRGMA
jgi:class 3 adenylate cyclase